MYGQSPSTTPEPGLHHTGTGRLPHRNRASTTPEPDVYHTGTGPHAAVSLDEPAPHRVSCSTCRRKNRLRAESPARFVLPNGMHVNSRIPSTTPEPDVYHTGTGRWGQTDRTERPSPSTTPEPECVCGGEKKKKTCSSEANKSSSQRAKSQ